MEAIMYTQGSWVGKKTRNKKKWDIINLKMKERKVPEKTL